MKQVTIGERRLYSSGLFERLGAWLIVFQKLGNVVGDRFATESSHDTDESLLDPPLRWELEVLLADAIVERVPDGDEEPRATVYELLNVPLRIKEDGRAELDAVTGGVED